MKIYLTTDTHFFHAKMLEFGRPKDYEENILKSLAAIDKDDLLIHLGDVCLSRDDEAHKRLFEAVKCKAWLLRGNHDRKSFSWYMRRGWDFVGDQVQLWYGGHDVLLSHRPVDMKNSSSEINIHGHLHDNIHRKEEHPFLGPKNYLLALERTKYQTVLLDTIVTNFFKKPSKAKLD